MGQKTVLITGASRGIGAATACELAAQGFQVAVNYSSRRDAAEATVATITRAGGQAFSVQAAVHKPGDLDRMFATVLERCGRLDVLVNNAGASGAATLEQITPEMIDETLAVNFKAVLLATQRAVQAFGPAGGAVINISSALAAQPFPGQTIYAASKAALETATRVLAQELGPRKVRVNAVAPGSTDTEFLQINEDGRRFVASRTALGRIGLPRDIARVVAFLASDAAAWVTGQVVGVDGGLRI